MNRKYALDRYQKSVLLTGILLVAVGLLFAGLQITGSPHLTTLIPLISGVVFLFGGMAIRIFGLLFLGCVLAGAGTGLLWATGLVTSSGENGPLIFLLCFSIGWLIVTPLSRLMGGRAVIWPLIPGIAGIIVSGGLLLF